MIITIIFYIFFIILIIFYNDFFIFVGFFLYFIIDACSLDGCFLDGWMAASDPSFCKTTFGETGCLGNPYFTYWLPKHPAF